MYLYWHSEILTCGVAMQWGVLKKIKQLIHLIRRENRIKNKIQFLCTVTYIRYEFISFIYIYKLRPQLIPIMIFYTVVITTATFWKIQIWKRKRLKKSARDKSVNHGTFASFYDNNTHHLSHRRVCLTRAVYKYTNILYLTI